MSWASHRDAVRSAEVEIVSHGRAGLIHYREGAQVHTFDWEFGGAGVVVTIYVPTPAAWDAKVPWAKGRRAEILDTLAREVCRQRCSGCEIELQDHWINLRESQGPHVALMAALRGLFRRSS